MMRLVILRILETYYRHRWLYLLPILVLTMAGIAAVLLAKPNYISRGVLYVQKGSLLATLTSVRQDTITFITPAEQTAEEIMDLLETDAFVRAVVRQTNLEPEMAEGPRAVRQLMRDVRKAVWATDQGDNQVMVAAAYEDAETAHQLATATIETYMQWRINADRAESAAAQAFFTDLIVSYQADLDEARRELEAFLEAYPEPLRGVRPTTERVQLARLESAIELATTRYANALDKEEDARLATAQAESDVRQSYVVIDAPVLADEPERSMRELAIQIVIFMGAGLILTAAAIAGGTLLDRSFRFPVDVHHHLELPVLAQVPGPAARVDPSPLRHDIDLPLVGIIPGTLRSRAVQSYVSRLELFCRLSEKGFNVAADNVANPGLKVILKGYAMERARYAARLRQERAQAGLWLRLRSVPLAALHRGWMMVKAALTVGDARRELKVLKECLRAERKLWRVYGRTIRKNLPVPLHTALLAQHARIGQIHEELRQLSAQSEAWLLPHYFTSKEDADQAVQNLRQAGFGAEEVNVTALAPLMRSLQPGSERGYYIADGILSGIVGGVLLGLVGGAVVGAATALTATGFSLESVAGVLETALATAAVGSGIGVLFGALLGSIIAIGVARENDDYLWPGTAAEAVLLTVRSKPQQAPSAREILRGQNVAQADSTSEPLPPIAAAVDSE
jgi:uncharacterized protein (TIGR02284 family)